MYQLLTVIVLSVISIILGCIAYLLRTYIQITQGTQVESGVEYVDYDENITQDNPVFKMMMDAYTVNKAKAETIQYPGEFIQQNITEEEDSVEIIEEADEKAGDRHRRGY